MTDYTERWKAAGLKAQGSSPFLPPPPDGFTRAYYFTSADYAMSGVALRRLKVARFSDANDPFELLGVRIRKENVRRAVKEFKKLCNKTTGLLCFSQDWTHPLLWSHYAAKHKGICLGFNLRSKIVKDVLYVRDRPDLGDQTSSFVVNDDLKERLLLTKSSHWAYESELRMIIELSRVTKEGLLYFRPFSPADMVLAEVILGERCTLPPKTVRELVRLTNPSAVVFRSRTEFGSFRVKINGYDLESVAEQMVHNISDSARTISSHSA
jgi:hypothetical protein